MHFVEQFIKGLGAPDYARKGNLVVTKQTSCLSTNFRSLIAALNLLLITAIGCQRTPEAEVIPDASPASMPALQHIDDPNLELTSVSPEGNTPEPLPTKFSEPPAPAETNIEQANDQQVPPIADE